jgi:hypothetical protein
MLVWRGNYYSRARAADCFSGGFTFPDPILISKARTTSGIRVLHPARLPEARFSPTGTPDHGLNYTLVAILYILSLSALGIHIDTQ